jgi:hypothetical protein
MLGFVVTFMHWVQDKVINLLYKWSPGMLYEQLPCLIFLYNTKAY